MIKVFWNINKVYNSWWGEYFLNHKDWINLMIKDLNYKLIDQLENINSDDLVLIIDCDISKKVEFYSNLKKKIKKIYLFHLGDEASTDLNSNVYEKFEFVWKNYFNNKFKSVKNCAFFPLGFKSKENFKKINLGERKYIWSFSGTIHGSSRYDMLYQLKDILPNNIKLTTEFGSKDSLNSEKYYEIICNSIYVPVPHGFFHPETYRFYEALEAGCIPLVENPHNFYDFIYPNNPIQKLTTWTEAKKFIKESYKNESLKSEYLEELDYWWKNLIKDFQKNISNKIS